MNISAISNNGIAVQQFSYEQKSSGNRSAGATSEVQAGTTAQTGQAEKKGTNEQKVQQEVQRLKTQEEKVKSHEAAHKSAGGQYASSASYSYRPGPDGRSYIVGGEVQIDMSPGKTPQETIAKMQVVQRAAMAPADPSGQDRAVAAQAAAQSAQAQQDQLKQDTTGQTGGSSESSAASAPVGKTSETKSSVTGSDAAPGTATDTRSAATSNDTKQLDRSAAATTSDTERTTRQMSTYQANTTPGDIFAAQKVSTYA